MSTHHRCDFPGALHHVSTATHHRLPLLDDPDFIHDLHARFARLHEHGIDVLSYARMSDHFHALLRSRLGELSAAMREFLAPLAIRHNGRLVQRGAVFERPYWSRPVLNLPQARYLAAYIHRNPLRRGGNLDTGNRTSHRPWCDERFRPEWLLANGREELFGGVEAYLAYMEAFAATRQPPGIRQICRSLPLQVDEAIAEVAAVYGVRRTTLLDEERGARWDRKLLAWWLRERDGLSDAEIGRALGVRRETAHRWWAEVRQVPHLTPLRDALFVMSGMVRP